jgi:hypothetical protein
MKRIITTTFSFFLFTSVITAQNNDSLMIRNIFNEMLSNAKCYPNLGELCKIGPRLSGSPGAQKAVEWTMQAMKDAGADTVYLQECMVPHWVRGDKETAKFISSKGNAKPVNVCALGGSIATPPMGLTANVIEVDGLDALAKLTDADVRGKIVFFNKPMDPTKISTFHAYGGAVGQRWAGAMKAAQLGAVGVVVRSMTLAQDDNPHTGSMGYDEKIIKIPGCAISTNGANTLSAMLKKDPNMKFSFFQNCKSLPDEKSYNVVGEIRGTEKKNEIIVVGGHLDAWDLGDGAHDDGSGVVQSIEVLRTFKALGIKPKRTIRAVAFMNEENGGRGGDKYAELAKENKEFHLAAIESDAGGFTPRGFGIEGKDDKIKTLQKWQPLLLPYGLHEMGAGHGGSDIEPLKEQEVTLIGLSPDSQRYFDYHHTAIDTFDKINKRELELGAASMAALIWLLSEYGL